MKKIDKIRKRLQEIDDNIWIIDMIDRWDEESSKRFEELKEEKKKLLLEMEELKNGK